MDKYKAPIGMILGVVILVCGFLTNGPAGWLEIIIGAWAAGWYFGMYMKEHNL